MHTYTYVCIYTYKGEDDSLQALQAAKYRTAAGPTPSFDMRFRSEPLCISSSLLEAENVRVLNVE